MESKKIINGDCWLAYFDILGFSNMVENFPVESVREKFREAQKKGEEYKVNCKFIFFSDTFIFYTEDDSKDSFLGISVVSEYFFQAMFLEEIPMRGCLNLGKFYVDEENGIFFGCALIDAYDLSENQNWIGFVLSEGASEKSEAFKSNNDFNYLKYKIPYKKKPKRKKTKRQELFVYYPNLLIVESIPKPAENQQKRLLDALDNMKYTANLMYQKNLKMKKCKEYKDAIVKEHKGTIIKYKNTKKFLQDAYPLLRKRFERKYPKCNNSDR